VFPLSQETQRADETREPVLLEVAFEEGGGFHVDAHGGEHNTELVLGCVGRRDVLSRDQPRL
jgi:hypothetical protein